jgi:hypothetical protein
MIPVRKVSETATSITLGWDPVPNADGYRFYSAGVLRSKTMDPRRRTVKFSKGQSPYRIEAVILNHLDQGSYPPPTQPPPQPTPTYKRVAPITVTEQGGSNQRVCLFTGEVEGGPLRPGVVQLPDGRYTDDSKAIYQSNGLEDTSVRTRLPEGAFGLVKAREMDSRNACQCHTAGKPEDNSGSWTV